MARNSIVMAIRASRISFFSAYGVHFRVFPGCSIRGRALRSTEVSLEAAIMRAGSIRSPSQAPAAPVRRLACGGMGVRHPFSRSILVSAVQFRRQRSLSMRRPSPRTFPVPARNRRRAQALRRPLARSSMVRLLSRLRSRLLTASRRESPIRSQASPRAVITAHTPLFWGRPGRRLSGQPELVLAPLPSAPKEPRSAAQGLR